MRIGFHFTCAASAALLLSLVAPLHAQQRLYGVTFNENQLLTFDRSSGEAQLVGSLGSMISPYGIANRFGSLFTFDPNIDRIRQIDPASGSITGSPIDIGVGNLIGEGDLAFRADGIGFLASALDPAFNPTNDFFRFDLTSGTSVRLGSTRLGGTGIPIDGLAFSPAGVLFALGQGEASLFTVDQSNGNLTKVGDLGIPQDSFVAGLTFDSNGILYGAIDDQLYTINSVSGAAFLANPASAGINFGGVSGLAFGPLAVPPAVGVPEGGSGVVLLSIALLSMLALRRSLLIAETARTARGMNHLCPNDALNGAIS